MARIASFEVIRLDLPLKRPFVTALGRKTATKNAAVRLRLKDGSQGYGEASSSLALAHLSPERLEAALTAIGRAFLGAEADDWRGLARRAWARWGAVPPAASAFEAALAEAALASAGLSLRRWAGGAQDRLESDLTISAVDPASAGRAAAEARAQGYRKLKVKLDGGEDWARIEAVARARPAGLLLDGNQALSVNGSLKIVERCLKRRLPVELIEQPLPKADWRGLGELSRRCPVPVALDESVMGVQDALRAVSELEKGVINIKLAKCGIHQAIEIAAVARAAGFGLMIGCMAESAAGLSASVGLAMGLGCFGFIDLDSDELLSEPGEPRGWKRDGPRLIAKD